MSQYLSQSLFNILPGKLLLFLEEQAGTFFSICFLPTSSLVESFTLCYMCSQFTNWPPQKQGRERPEKVRGHSRLVGDRFNKQGRLYLRPILGGCKISRSPHLSIKILMFRQNLNTAQSSILSRWSEQPYSLEIIHLEQLPLGDWWQNIHSKDRGGDIKSPYYLSTAHRSTGLAHSVTLVAETVERLPAMWETGCDPRLGKIPWRRKWQPTPVLLPGKFHGLRSLVGYSPWGCKETQLSDFTFTFFPTRLSKS